MCSLVVVVDFVLPSFSFHYASPNVLCYAAHDGQLSHHIDWLCAFLYFNRLWWPTWSDTLSQTTCFVQHCIQQFTNFSFPLLTLFLHHHSQAPRKWALLWVHLQILRTNSVQNRVNSGLGSHFLMTRTCVFTQFDVSTNPKKWFCGCTTNFKYCISPRFLLAFTLSAPLLITGFNFLCTDDFVPASVDPNKTSIVDFGSNGKVTVTMPNLEGSGTGRESVYQGMRKPHQKECVLIFNPDTGEFVLEKLNTSMIVKKARLRQDDSSGKPLNTVSNNQKPTLSNGSSSSGPSSSQAKSSTHNDKVKVNFF